LRFPVARSFRPTASKIALIDDQLERLLEPFRERVELLKTIPGVNRVMAAVIIGEISPDMAAFPTTEQLVRGRDSARGTTRVPASAARPDFARAGPGSSRRWSRQRGAPLCKKDSYLRSQYHRIRGRRGTKKAIIAVAASMLTAIYYVLRDRVPYRDLGPAHFDARHKARAVNRLVKRLGDLGYNVTLDARGTAA
jgi:transposase